MKSTMRIDFKGLDDETRGFEPVISVNLENSDDPRDGLLKAFFEELGGQSSWLVVNFHHNDLDLTSKIITIHPIRPDELEETLHIINNRLGYSLKENPLKEK